jgi:integrase
MGRRAQGPTYRPVGGIWTIRFRHGGHRQEYSTGVKVEPGEERESPAAATAGGKIYADVIAGKRPARSSVATPRHRLNAEGFAALLDDWIESLPVREITREQYRTYSGQWLREWSTWPTEPEIAAYTRRRLREVTRKSVVNELSALRNFSTWAVETGELAEPLIVPRVPKSTLGKAYAVRRRTRAPELSETEIEALLAALPERSGMAGTARGLQFPVRDRFVVMWDTTLRPETLDQLSVPEHWAPGEVVLRVTAAIDKEGAGRDVPLTRRALAALARVAPASGLIFGAHRYDRFLRAAAMAVLPPSKAAIFTGQHIRSAAITRALERSGNLPGTMYLAGHAHASTTSRYVRPTQRAALAVLASLGAPPMLSGEDSGEDLASP